jgi:ATP adenylyltransferase
MKRKTNCPFCILAPGNEILDSNEHAIALLDMYPISELHTLVIPRRHAVNYFKLEYYEQQSIHELLISEQKKITAKDDTVKGFNIGWNCGETAGQTVFHAHAHLIPRRKDDVAYMQTGKRNREPFTDPWHSKSQN